MIKYLEFLIIKSKALKAFGYMEKVIIKFQVGMKSDFQIRTLSFLLKYFHIKKIIILKIIIFTCKCYGKKFFKISFCYDRTNN